LRALTARHACRAVVSPSLLVELEIINGSQGEVEKRSDRWFSPLQSDDVVRLAVADR